MFGTFEEKRDAARTKRLALAAGAAVGLYLIAGGALVSLASGAKPPPPPKPVELTFRPPPPPPPPPPAAAPPPAPVPAVIPANVKVKRVAMAKPRPRPAPPKVIPIEKPPEADPATAEIELPEGPPAPPDAPEVVASLIPAPPAEEPGPAPAPPVRRGPIHLPEEAVPPEALDGNITPDYPAEARASGREGQVILKIVVGESGSVEKVELMRGEEPFASAALQAVRRWRYSPALVDGVPTAVYRIVKIPFRLRG
jgi:protein TonB